MYVCVSLCTFHCYFKAASGVLMKQYENVSIKTVNPIALYNNIVENNPHDHSKLTLLECIYCLQCNMKMSVELNRLVSEHVLATTL